MKIGQAIKHENWLFGKDGALFRAAATGNLSLAAELVQAGANVNCASLNGVTPLHLAAQNGHGSIVRFLLERGADALAQSRSMETPLSLARSGGHEETVRLLQRHVTGTLPASGAALPGNPTS